jgi:hypothetical protein
VRRLLSGARHKGSILQLFSAECSCEVRNRLQNAIYISLDDGGLRCFKTMSGSVVVVLCLAAVSSVYFGVLALIQFRAGRKWRLFGISAAIWVIVTIAALCGWIPPL